MTRTPSNSSLRRQDSFEMDALAIVVRHAMSTRQWGVVGSLCAVNRHLASIRPDRKSWIWHVQDMTGASGAVAFDCACVHVCAFLHITDIQRLDVMARSSKCCITVDGVAFDDASPRRPIERVRVSSATCDDTVLATGMWTSVCASSGRFMRSMDLALRSQCTFDIVNRIPPSVCDVRIRFEQFSWADRTPRRIAVHIAHRCRRLFLHDVGYRGVRAIFKKLAASPPRRLRHIAVDLHHAWAWRSHRKVYDRLARAVERGRLRTVELHGVPPHLDLLPSLKRIQKAAGSLRVIISAPGWKFCHGEREEFLFQLRRFAHAEVATHV